MEEYIDLLKKVEHFSELSHTEIKELVMQCEIIELNDDEVLFKQNDKSDAMYILITGYLLISVEHENTDEEQISSVHPGEVIGELGVFTNKPRSATAKALLKSKLIKLTSVVFYNFIHTHTQYIDKIIPLLADRAHHALRLATRIKKRPFHKHILLVPYGEAGKKFEYNLRMETLRNSKIHFCEPEKILTYLRNHDALGLLNYLDHLEKQADVIIYVVEPELLATQEKILHVLFKRTNTLVFAHKGGKTSEEFKSLYDSLKELRHPSLKTELILLWNNHDYIDYTIDWLNQCSYHLHHHIKIQDSKDYRRFIRYICGKAIGLVLSGGGSRVWYHFGVLKAIMEKGIPIDAVGGTSAGAGIGACYLSSDSIEEIFEMSRKFSRSFQKSVYLRNLTYPLISLFNAVPATKMVKTIFHERHIEDFHVPYFAISTNMNKCSEKVMNKGLVWKAVRATSALPGIFPPLEHNGELLFDGGLLNNLPTDHMRELLGDQAIIIASDISIDEKDPKHYSIPPMLPLSETIKSKIILGKDKIVHPPFISTLIKALLVGGVDHYRRNVTYANYHICSDLSQYGLFIFDKKTINRLIQAGYDATNNALKDINSSL